MSGFVFILRCVGEAAVAKGLKGLCSLVPMGEFLFEVAADSLERIKKGRQDQQLRDDMAELVRAAPEEVRRSADAVAAEVAAGHPPAVRQALTAYLEQVPATFRRTLERPADPTGRSVPAGLALNRPEHLLPFLPSRLPRYKAGDRPTPGGNWELTDLLGMGGFGEVWKARHRSMQGMTAAIKFCLDEQASASLRNEAALIDRVMQQTDHPGILVPRDAYLDMSPPCLIYPYIPGGDLIGVGRELERLPPEKRLPQALAVMRRLAEIVGHAHRLDPPIVHRDLKPANVLVLKRPDGKLDLRVTDFGIGGIAARRAIDAELQGHTSRSAQMISSLRGSHTPLYASKQQKYGADPDPRDDVFSLGVITFQLMVGDLTSGVSPTWTDELEEIGASDAVIQVVKSCLAAKAERRPKDAMELSAALAGLTRATGAPPPTAALVAPAPALPAPAPPAAQAVTDPALMARLEKLLAAYEASTGPAPAPTEVQVVLEAVEPARKIMVIKVLRELTGAGLLEAKRLAESTPAVVMDNVPSADAERIRLALQQAGGQVALRPVQTTAAAANRPPLPGLPGLAGGQDRGAAPPAVHPFNHVVLEGLVDRTKVIPVIKVVRELTGLGLAEAKTLVDTAPKVVLENLPSAAADHARSALTLAGGRVTLRPAGTPAPPVPPAPGAQRKMTVVLETINPSRKFDAIRELRALTGCGLEDAQATLASLPATLGLLPAADAERVKVGLEQVGAKVTLRGFGAPG